LSDKYFTDLKDKFPMVTFHKVNDFTSTMLMHIPLNKVSSKAKVGWITRRQVENIVKKTKELLDIDVLVSYGIVDNKLDIENGLSALIRANIKRRSVSAINVSFLDSENAVTFIFCQNLEKNEKNKINDLVNNYFLQLKISSNEIIYYEKNNPEPSPMALLRSLKINFPVTLNDFLKELKKEGYYIESEEWLSRKLDTFRKRSFLIRDRDGFYRLTLTGQGLVPITKSRNSSDIERILKLAKKHL